MIREAFTSHQGRGGNPSFALLAAGCSSSGGDAGTSSNPITLTVTTFGTMGFDKLYSQYEKEHPGIKIKATNIDTGDNALTDWQTKEAAGSGLPDVQAVEEGWLSKVMQVSDQFNDLKDYGANDIKSRWVDWKLKQATDKNGRIIGYGTDIGPEGLCYNGKLFAAAGLPSDRDSVAKLFGGDNATWDDFFKVGEQYKAATGKAFYDQSGFIWNAMVNQQPEGYYTKDGKLNIEASWPAAQRRDSPPTRPSGTGARARRSPTARSPRSSARAGCSASCRARSRPAAATPPPAGTSPTSSRAARPTGAARS